MSPSELRDQSVAEIVEDFETAAAYFDPLLALPYARRGLHQLQSAALGGQCSGLEPTQRDSLIRAYMAMLKNIGPTVEGIRPYPAFGAWSRGPVGVILFWFDHQSIDPSLIGNVVSLGLSFAHLISDIEILQSTVERCRETPGLLAFIEQAMADHADAVPMSN